MPEYYISDEAAADLHDIWRGHIERGGSEANADAIIAGLLVAFQNLADFPDIGRPRAFLKPYERALPHDDFLIVYEMQPDRLAILHVVSGRMNLPAYFAEDE